MRSIHQMLAGLSFGDAIGNDARNIRAALREWGYTSEIFVNDLDPKLAQEAVSYREFGRYAERDSGLLLHHSIGGPVSEAALRARAKRMIVYHNITPAQFFAPYDEQMARLCAEGRAGLRGMRSEFALALADSAYNAAELEALGFARVRVLPILVSFAELDLPACPRTLRELEGDERKVLFVGRVVPNKKQDDLVTAFAYYQRINPRSRLYLVGGYGPEERYYQAVQERIRETGATGVVMTGKVSQEELNAYYRRADLFVSMSEHEGFGVPLVEAMHFGVPVLAYRAAAVPETLGGAGVLFGEKRYAEIAEMMDLLMEEEGLRARVVAGQRRRLQDFLPERVLKQLWQVICEFTCGNPASRPARGAPEPRCLD
jgi:glycosyltransferase involved in cell wall biosynthesis